MIHARIRKLGDPVLREKAAPVDTVDESIESLSKELVERMAEADGMGLAATQIGVLRQVFVFKIEDKIKTFINPVIIDTSSDEETDEEGCLSLPVALKLPISRPVAIRFRALNIVGEEEELDAEGLLARVLQHEVDHLNGVLIIDRATPEVRREALKAIKESLIRASI